MAEMSTDITAILGEVLFIMNHSCMWKQNENQSELHALTQCTLSVGSMLFPVLLEGEAKTTNGIVFKRIKKVVKKDTNNDIIKLLL